VNSSPRKPRVLLVTPDFPPAFGGIQRLTHRLAQHLERVEARVVALESPGAEVFDRAEPLSIVRVRRFGLGGHPNAVAVLNARAVAEALRFRPHVVLVAHIFTSPAALAIKRLLGTPYVQYLHGREIIIRPRLTRAGLRGAAAAVAVSSYTRELALSHGAPEERIHLVPPGIDLVGQATTARSATPTVVTIARLEQRYKGHDVLLRALPLVRSRVPQARLVVVGDGPLRPVYEGLALSLALDDGVEFAGALDDVSRDRVLDRAHVFAMPSRLPLDGGGEGFGIVYLEAAVHGLPVVAGNVAGALDAVVHDDTGLLVDPTDHVAVADALTTLLLDLETAARLGCAGAQRAQEFAWPKIAERVEDLLLEVAR
jgi:phosphatidyl-myo-inositol dimannoside synthase